MAADFMSLPSWCKQKHQSKLRLQLQYALLKQQIEDAMSSGYNLISFKLLKYFWT